MRLPLVAIALVLAAPAVPAAGQKPAAADDRAERILTELGMSPEPGELQAAIERAAAEPLGSAQNPVRVGGPSGEHAYIARLRCSDGATPRVGERANAGIGVFGTIVDVYPLDCRDAAPGRVELVMDMYHSRHHEDRAPPGFTIVPR